MPLFQGGFLCMFHYALIPFFLLQVVSAGKSDLATGKGYSYGQPLPVTCLNRTIDSGEHITDNLGKLQFIPFPTCNETFLPLALRYGVTETVNCTINALPDELYHLLEYYVHSDVPLTCRVPTAPLLTSGLSTPDDKTAGGTDLNNEGPSYTPLTFALQGTLQRSHLHIWTDMNVLVHNIASTKKSKRKSKKTPGYVVAGTAYSVPEFDGTVFEKDEENEAAAVVEAARDPWTAGHGTKVIRGEPLTFTFHVTWVEGGKGIWWPSEPSSGEPFSVTGFISKVFFFGLAASVGALIALFWERRRRAGWRGDGGILGVPAVRGKGTAGVSFGNGGRTNGYGGYSAASSVGGGYGGFGKKD